MSVDLPVENPRRWWYWPRRIAVGLLTCLAAITVAQYVQSRITAAKGREELAKVLAETTAKDPRWTWEQIHDDLPPIPEAENSMPVIRAAAKAIGEWGQNDTTLEDGEEALDLHLPANRRLADDRLAVVHRELARRESGLRLALKVKNLPRGRSAFELKANVLETLLPHVQPCREVNKLFIYDSERLLHTGTAGDVPDRIVAMLNTQAALKDDPFLISLLVRLAIQGLAVDRVERLLGMAVVGDGHLQQLQAAVAQLHAEEPLAQTLRGERALYRVLFENLDQGRLSLTDFWAQIDSPASSPPSLSLRLGSLMYSRNLYHDQAFLLTKFADFLETTRLPVWEQRAKWQESDDELRDLRKQTSVGSQLILALLLLPRLPRVTDGVQRTQAQLACATVALAAERFRLANKRWPTSLEELRPRYLTEIPPDPFTGKPLLYVPKEHGVAIYSVGPDGLDGHGDQLRPPKHHVTLPHDLGVRLWDPDHRGLPALPPDKE